MTTTQEIDTQTLLTTGDFAERVKVNVESVRRWARGGHISASKMGPREWRIPASELKGRTVRKQS